MFDKSVVKNVSNILKSCVEFACKDKCRLSLHCVFFRFNEKKELIELVATDSHTLIRYINTAKSAKGLAWELLSAIFKIENESFIKECELGRDSKDSKSFGISVSLNTIKKAIKLLSMDGGKTQIILNTKEHILDATFPPYLNVIPQIRPIEECKMANFCSLNPKYLARLETPFELCDGKEVKFLFQNTPDKSVLWKGSNIEKGFAVEAVIMPIRD